MIYREMDPSTRFSAVPKGQVVLQAGINAERSDGGQFAAAIYPGERSATWYFLTPSGEVWINGLDGKENVKECIVLFPTLDLAREELTRMQQRWPNHTRSGLFETLLDNDGDLCLRLIVED